MEHLLPGPEARDEAYLNMHRERSQLQRRL